MQPMMYHQMGYATKRYYDRLSAYQAPLVKEKILLEKELTEPEFGEAFLELKKFVALCRHSGRPLAMTSPQIDTVWHQFILFTREYHSFCDEFFGGFLHHSPNVPSRPGAPGLLENLIESYESTFGPIPAIWGITKQEVQQ